MKNECHLQIFNEIKIKGQHVHALPIKNLTLLRMHTPCKIKQSYIKICGFTNYVDRSTLLVYIGLKLVITAGISIHANFGTYLRDM